MHSCNAVQCGGYPDLCSYPESVFDPSANFLFGQCQFTNVSKEQLALSDELMQAVKSGPSTLFPCVATSCLVLLLCVHVCEVLVNA